MQIRSSHETHIPRDLIRSPQTRQRCAGRVGDVLRQQRGTRRKTLHDDSNSNERPGWQFSQGDQGDR